MISRRNIRVKVMQTLYTVTTMEPGDAELNKKKGTAILNEKLNRSLDLFIVSILYTFRTAQYAETDAAQRSSKYLPTAEDLNVSTRIAANEFMWKILSNQTFTEKVKEVKAEQFIDDEWIKKLYLQLVQSNEYKAYISATDKTAASEKAIIQYIWNKLIVENESLQEYFTEELAGWEDDKEMVVMLMDNLFKSSSKINFLNHLSEEKREYAHNLMQTVIDKEEYCMTLIQPKLINWDADRVALIDLILLRMGVSELLYFPTIPTKVTINEYIEIAKLYSTPQSGQFVNGVLDNILKDLEKENLIHKQDHSRKS
ncbi:MAG: transcription antitermination factor NusB [Bacteroidetes bacterium]|nr:transcription antitermination factor NusB [Bacteroidota bacterium]